MVRHWGHHLVRQVMNAFPGRAQQLAPPPPATAQPAAAAATSQGASQAVAQAAAQPAAPSQHLQSPRHLSAEPNAGPAQILAQSPALGSQPLPKLPAAPRLHPPAEHGADVGHQADITAGGWAAQKPPQAQAGAQATPQGSGSEVVHVPGAAVHAGSSEAAHVQEAVGSVGIKAAQVLEAATPVGSDSLGLQEAPVPEAAVPSGRACDGSGSSPLSEAAAPSGRAHDGSGPALLPEAATLAGTQDTTIHSTREQPQMPHDPLRPPSILQDLRNAAAAAQDTVQQPQHPASPTAGLGSQQGSLDAMRPPQQALPQLQSLQGVTSKQEESRLTAAAQSASLASPWAPKAAAAPLQPGPPCSQHQRPPASPTPAQTPDAIFDDQGPTAGSNQARQVAGASQTLVNETTAVAEHSDSLSTALLPKAEVTAITAVHDKQPLVRSQRLFEKKAAAAAAQAAADAVVKAAALQDPVTLGGVSIKQAGLALAPTVEVVSSSVPLVLAECLASNRSKRVPGGDPLEVSSPPFPPPLPQQYLHPALLLPGCCVISLCACISIQQLSSKGMSAGC